MAVKRLNLEEIGEVSFYKRKGARSIRLSVRSDGTIRVTMPHFTPYQAAVAFVHSHREWLQGQIRVPAQLENAQAVGKQHRLQLIADFTLDSPRSRVTKSGVIVRYPAHLDASDIAVQKVAQAASIRAMRSEAEELLPARLADLAARHNFLYKSVSVKRLKGRWGSCDQDKNIVLNLFLMQLPWHLIDYVLLHELTHTRIMRHGPPFWQAMAQLDPSVSALRREMREYRPVIH
jgi:predicted metal-dependent hydrolase